MAHKTGFFRRYRIVLHSSPLWLKFGLLITVLVAIVALSVIGGKYAVIKTQYEQWRQYAASLEQVNAQYQDKIDNWGSIDSVTDIAGEELGMVDKDATIIPVRPQENPLDLTTGSPDSLILYITVAVAVLSLLFLGGGAMVLYFRAKGLPQPEQTPPEEQP